MRSMHRVVRLRAVHGTLSSGPLPGTRGMPLATIASTARRNVSFFRKPKPAVVEDAEESQLQDIKHTIRTTEILDSAKVAALNGKLLKLIGEEFTDEAIQAINEVYMALYKMNGVTEVNRFIPLLDRSADYLLSKESVVLPEYLSILIPWALQASELKLKNESLIRLALLASKLNNNNLSFVDAIVLFLKSGRHVSNSLVSSILKYLAPRGKLNLQVFEDICKLTKEEFTLRDSFYTTLVAYVEELLANPSKGLESNIFRVQQCFTIVGESIQFEALNLTTVLAVHAAISELEASNTNTHLAATNVKFLGYLESIDPKLIGNALATMESPSTIVDTLLTSAFTHGFKKLGYSLFSTVRKRSMFFPSDIFYQARMYQGFLDTDEQELFPKVQEFLGLEETSPMYLKLIQAFVTSGKVPPNGVFVEQLHQALKDEGVEVPLMGYKLLIDASIQRNDPIEDTLAIFDQSLKDYAQWSDAATPAVVNTLNNLVVQVAQKVDDIHEVFVAFTRIKQHLAMPINVYAVAAMCKRMLEAEYVGDCIELLKRELPETKLPLLEPFGFAYRHLFDLLHDFVVTYTSEDTFETNWVLYGELHKFFHVPYESYLPAMRFFCEHDRLNAALIIIKRVRELYEKHGAHHNLPPSKEMYMYLFQEFGDKLYEEGVDEIHGLLKTDIALPRQDIPLQNSILNAYSNLQEVGKVRDLFLAMNPLGAQNIDQDTAQIMLKTYTYSDLNYVKAFWNNLSSMGIYPTYPVFRQYLIAHVYHGFPDQAIALTDEMEDYDLSLTDDTVAALYNFCMSSKHQDTIEQWATRDHRELWESAQSRGLLKRTNNYLPETSLLIGL